MYLQVNASVQGEKEMLSSRVTQAEEERLRERSTTTQELALLRQKIKLQAIEEDALRQRQIAQEQAAEAQTRQISEELWALRKEKEGLVADLQAAEVKGHAAVAELVVAKDALVHTAASERDKYRLVTEETNARLVRAVAQRFFQRSVLVFFTRWKLVALRESLRDRDRLYEDLFEKSERHWGAEVDRREHDLSRTTALLHQAEQFRLRTVKSVLLRMSYHKLFAAFQTWREAAQTDKRRVQLMTTTLLRLAQEQKFAAFSLWMKASQRRTKVARMIQLSMIRVGRQSLQRALASWKRHCVRSREQEDQYARRTLIVSTALARMGSYALLRLFGIWRLKARTLTELYRRAEDRMRDRDRSSSLMLQTIKRLARTDLFAALRHWRKQIWLSKEAHQKRQVRRCVDGRCGDGNMGG